MVETPEDILDAVPAEAKIQGPALAESGLPVPGTIGLLCFRFPAPEVSDRVSDEHHFGIKPIFDTQHVRMAGIPIVTVILQFRRRNEGGIVRHLDRERFVVHQLSEGRFDGLSPSLRASRTRVQ